MIGKSLLMKGIAVGLLWVGLASEGVASPVGTEFTYQGLLKEGGSAVTGDYDFQFALYDSDIAVVPVAGPISADDLSVVDGLFTVELDFGGAEFSGEARWVGISVRPGASAGAYTALTPYQPLTAAPQSIYAQKAPWGGLIGVPAGFADGVDNNTTYSAGAGLGLAGTTFSISANGVVASMLASDVNSLAKVSGNAMFSSGDSIGINTSSIGATLDIVGDPEAVIRLSNAARGGTVATVSFGLTDDCSLGVTPSLPGLLLRDPNGIRLIPRDYPISLPRLILGPPGGPTIGMGDPDPEPNLQFTSARGFVMEDDSGMATLQLMSTSGTGASLQLGPTDLCAIETDLQIPGLILRDPYGIRLIPRDYPVSLPQLIFGPIGGPTIAMGDPSPQPSLNFQSNNGFVFDGDGYVTSMRLSSTFGLSSSLLFGPTDDCVVETSYQFPGLLLRDPFGIRLIPRDYPNNLPRLIFGPDGDPRIEVLDPTPQPALHLRAFNGFVFDGDGAPTVLRIGYTSNTKNSVQFDASGDCAIETDIAIPGLMLRDPNGIRIIPRNPQDIPQIRFGLDDDVFIALGDPSPQPSIVFSNPTGFKFTSGFADTRVRVGSKQGAKAQILMGPTDDCNITVDPQLPGLQLQDPFGVRVIPPTWPNDPACLKFGPTDDCFICIDPILAQFRFRDPHKFIFDGGFVGMGDFDPVFRLELPNIQTVSGQGRANAWTTYSSYRWKENITPIDDALDKLAQLEGVYFNWKPEYGGGPRDIGFVAEDVGHVLPELVLWEEEGKTAHSMKYDRMTALLVQGVNEQQTQVAALEMENAQLRQQMTELQKQMNELQKQIAAILEARP